MSPRSLPDLPKPCRTLGNDQKHQQHPLTDYLFVQENERHPVSRNSPKQFNKNLDLFDMLRCCSEVLGRYGGLSWGVLLSMLGRFGGGEVVEAVRSCLGHVLEEKTC